MRGKPKQEGGCVRIGNGKMIEVHVAASTGKRPSDESHHLSS